MPQLRSKRACNGTKGKAVRSGNLRGNGSNEVAEVQRTGCKTRTIQGVGIKSGATTAVSLAWEGRKEGLYHGGSQNSGFLLKVDLDCGLYLWIPIFGTNTFKITIEGLWIWCRP